MEDKKVKGKFFDKPQGKTERSWNNVRTTLEDITCTCGTFHSFRDLKDLESYDYLEFDGKIIVLSCCGAFFDRILKELGPEFFIQTVDEFIHDPLAEKYGFVRRNLEIGASALNKAAKKAPKLAKVLKKLLDI